MNALILIGAVKQQLTNHIDKTLFSVYIATKK